MPLALRIMDLLGVALLVVGLPLLLAPGFVRSSFRLRATPQMAYVLRICGTMIASLGLVLMVFARSYWAASSG